VSRLPTLGEAAELIGVTWCADCADYRHDLEGSADPSRGVIHFSQRAPSRATLRKFFKAAGAIIHSHNRGQPIWVQLYEQNRFAYSTARRLRIKIPSALADTDRAWAQDALSRAHQETSKEIRQWMSNRH
jgi:hypothetical protein